MSFQVGDRVVCVKQYGNVAIGETGTYVHRRSLGPEHGIMWDREHPNRHSCNYHCERKHGFYVSSECIRLDTVKDLGDFLSNLTQESFVDLFGG